MILLILGLHLVLGSIWLMNNDYTLFGICAFVAGIAATHYGWKQVHAKKQRENDEHHP